MWWIIGVAAVLLLLAGLKKRIKRMNPVNSLTYDGTLGFRIGDKRAFVENRVRHLKLTPYKEAAFGYKISNLTVASDMFNNIKHVNLGINDEGELDTIEIVFYNYHGDIYESYRSMRHIVEGRIGEPSFVYDDRIHWLNGKKCIGLIRDNDAMSILINYL